MVRFKVESYLFTHTFSRRFHPTMLRFKAICRRENNHRTGGFHPTMVRFKGEIIRAAQRNVTCFHPTMVRFKDGFAMPSGRSNLRFHPTMVRFKVPPEFRVLICYEEVSIPLWCDLKARDESASSAALSCFHPTMVRFKGSPMMRSKMRSIRFPSHYGAI